MFPRTPRRAAEWEARALPGRTVALVVAVLALVLAVLPGTAQATPGSMVAGAPAVAAAETAPGYWLLNENGSVTAFGAGSYGSLSGQSTNKPAICLSSTVDGGGYWLVASDGGIFSFGDAGFYGSLGSITLNQPIVGMAPTADGGGYWLVASDGGIFSFGDAGFYGSLGSITLNQPIVGMAPTADGGGYWLVASDGGIFSFGDARFYGSLGSITLNQPIVGMAPTADGGGYWLVASDGGIFSFGDAGYHGSLGDVALRAPIVGMQPSGDGNGYELAAEDGGVFTFGDATFAGSLGATPLTTPVIGMASPGHAGSCLGSYLPTALASPGPGGPPGEGQWTPAARRVGPTAAVYTTTLRPYVGGQPAGIAWIDTSRTKLALYAGPPGQPAGSFALSGEVAPANRSSLLAAFNSGFQVAQSEGGWYSEGQMPVPLLNGAASLVIYKSGSVAMGQWGRDFTAITPDMASVRQDLTLLVDHGQPSSVINDGGAWGAVIGGQGNTWRSGVGVTGYGDLVYVAGPDLYPWDLAHLLIAAGAVEGMELDINPQWPVFTTYSTVPGQPSSVVQGSNLLAGMFYPPNHYLTPVDRDFFALFAR